ncbi:MAG: Phosphatidate cytidylyltransferase [Bacteroidetes bacterium]|nr:Phosphatidate cytidylyltransferase [Bacteroidota bacterium]
MNNFFKRTLTAGAFVAVLLCATWYSHLTFSLLFFVVTVLGLWEFYTLSEKAGNKPQKIAGTLTGAFLFAANAWIAERNHDLSSLALLIPIFFLVFILELFRKKENPFGNIAYTLLGIFYVALPFSLLHHILNITGSYSYEILFGCWFILWSNDSGAYLAGSAFGKNKLFPRVSPGKSWEGSIGGAVIAYVITWIISGWYQSISPTDWYIIATILIVIGTLGDLVESLYKRSLNVKDSGTLLPGHGGILDRFDSLLMAIPFVFAYLYLHKL